MSILYTPRYAIPYTDDTSTMDLSHDILKNMVWTIDSLLWDNREFVNGVDEQIQHMWGSVAYTRATPSIVQIAPTITSNNYGLWIGKDSTEEFVAVGGALPTTVNYDWWYEWEFTDLWSGTVIDYFLVKDKGVHLTTPADGYEGSSVHVRARITDEIGNSTDWSNVVTKRYSTFDIPEVIAHEWDMTPVESGGTRKLTIHLNNEYAGISITPSSDADFTFEFLTLEGSTATFNVDMPDAFVDNDVTFTFYIETSGTDGTSSFIDTIYGNNKISMMQFMSPTEYSQTWYGDFKTFIEGDLKTMIWSVYDRTGNPANDGILKVTWDKNSGEVTQAHHFNVNSSQQNWIGNSIKIGSFYYTTAMTSNDFTSLIKYNADFSTIISKSVPSAKYGNFVFERSDGKLVWSTGVGRYPGRTYIQIVEPDTLDLIESFYIYNYSYDMVEPGFTVKGDKFYQANSWFIATLTGAGEANEDQRAVLYEFDVFTWQITDIVQLNGRKTDVWNAKAHFIDNNGDFIITTQDDDSRFSVSKVSADLQSYIVYPFGVEIHNTSYDNSVNTADIIHIGDKYLFLMHTWNQSDGMILECDTDLTNWKEWRFAKSLDWGQYFTIHTGGSFYDAETGRLEISGVFIDADWTTGAMQVSAPYPFPDLEGQVLYEEMYGIDFRYNGSPIIEDADNYDSWTNVILDREINGDEPHHDVDTVITTTSEDRSAVFVDTTDQINLWSFDIGSRLVTFKDVVVEMDEGDGHLPVISSSNWVQLLPVQ